MIQIKEGVDVRGLHSKLWDAIYIIEPLFTSKSLDLVITSGLDGRHSYKSLHFSGLAIDIRTRDYPYPSELCSLIKDLLPKAYDVVLEATHIHIEYQPKTRSEIDL